MYSQAKICRYAENEKGTYLKIYIPQKRLGFLLEKKCITDAEIRFDDGRHISAEQRKKAYATIRDIAMYTGYLPEEMKEIMKYEHMIRTGDAYFSLSDCTMDVAREFINTILEFALENGVPLSESALNRTDDIGRYLYYCIKHRKCAICGKNGEVHHEDTIGMGNNRNKVDDSLHRKICLCREHHTVAHQMGVKRFRDMYKVYGIVVKDMEVETPS